MLTLGLSGGLDLPAQSRDYLFPPGTCHDSASALAEDGAIVAAIEEERLNRIKHTRKGAIHAIRHCLNARNIALSDVDALVYYGSEDGCNTWMRNLFYGTLDAAPVRTFRELIHEMLREGVGTDIDDRKLTFVHHHLAHAISAYAQSGFHESLVVTIDGAGDGLCGSVTRWREKKQCTLALIPQSKSLGLLYDRVISMIGYGFTEEYKVMGLAPYGDATRFNRDLEALYSLLPQGDYAIHWERIESLYSLAPVRKRGEPLSQVHMDVAAALQSALERIVHHFLSYYRYATGLSSLCLAGGVAHNSTMNGRLLYSGLFEDIFVQPASHDAGCAIGAALTPFFDPQNQNPPAKEDSLQRIEHVYWGTHVGSTDQIDSAVRRWSPLIHVERVDDIAERAAALIADGCVIGWVQGRSEFGPRALGNRSILADPRPASNKDRINAMVKKRESYRPFAPAVTEERASEYFDLPRTDLKLPYMSFTVRVRSEWRERLGATTHIDGSARVQTVSKRANPEFWALIEAFHRRTGVAVLLNTSFNNNAEPIVDSIDDAVTCFLTTGLDYLVIGSCVVSKLVIDTCSFLNLTATVPISNTLVERIRSGANGARSVEHYLANSYDTQTIHISPRAYQLLARCADGRKLSDFFDFDPSASSSLAEEIRALWEKRVISLRPAGVATASSVSDRDA